MKDIIHDMKRIAADSPGDPETAHASADDLLMETISFLATYVDEDVPVDDLFAAYENVEKWYA